MAIEQVRIGSIWENGKKYPIFCDEGDTEHGEMRTWDDKPGELCPVVLFPKHKPENPPLKRE